MRVASAMNTSFRPALPTCVAMRSTSNTTTATTAPWRRLWRRRRCALMSFCTSGTPLYSLVTGSNSDEPAFLRQFFHSLRSRCHSAKPVKPLHTAVHSAATACTPSGTGRFIATAYRPAMAGSVKAQPTAITGASRSPSSHARVVSHSVMTAPTRDAAAAAGSCSPSGSARQARPTSGNSSALARRTPDMTRSRCAALSQARIQKLERPTHTGPASTCAGTTRRGFGMATCCTMPHSTMTNTRTTR